MPHILLVDDDRALLDVLAIAFGDAGHSVDTASDGAQAMDKLRSKAPDAVVSDVNMPGVDGFALCRRLRAEDNHVPLILLTSRDTEIDETLGLDFGADDYITKPFSTRVLLARIGALLRRDAFRRRGAAAQTELRSGELLLDPERLLVRFRGESVTVTLSEFRLLEALVRKPGIVMSRDRLLEIVRGDESVVVDRIIDTYVRRLRRKLEAVDPAFSGIETVVGAGYRLRAEP